jgi:hypothetical protein
VLAKVLEVCKQEGVEYSEDGLEAIVFTAQVRINQPRNIVEEKL